MPGYRAIRNHFQAMSRAIDIAQRILSNGDLLSASL
jgi:hypothetical protein